MIRWLLAHTGILTRRVPHPPIPLDRSGRPGYLGAIDAMEAEAVRLLVESARLRAARLGPDDAHELRHLWAAINAGNSDPCGVNGESCHLDVESIRRWTEQYPKVVGDSRVDRSGRPGYVP